MWDSAATCAIRSSGTRQRVTSSRARWARLARRRPRLTATAEVGERGGGQAGRDGDVSTRRLGLVAARSASGRAPPPAARCSARYRPAAGRPRPEGLYRHRRTSPPRPRPRPARPRALLYVVAPPEAHPSQGEGQAETVVRPPRTSRGDSARTDSAVGDRPVQARVLANAIPSCRPPLCSYAARASRVARPRVLAERPGGPLAGSPLASGRISSRRAEMAGPIPMSVASAPSVSVTGSTSSPDSSDQQARRIRSAVRCDPVPRRASTRLRRIDCCRRAGMPPRSTSA